MRRAKTALLASGVAIAVLIPGCSGSHRPRNADRPGPEDVGRRAAILEAEQTRTVGGALLAVALEASPDLRRRAIRALGRIGDAEGGLTVVADALDDAAAEVRAAAVVARASLEPGGLDWTDRFAADEDPLVREAVAGVLARGSSRDLDRLARLLADPDPAVRARAAASAPALALDPARMDALVATADDDDPRARYAALAALADLAVPGSALGTGLEAFATRRAARARLLRATGDPDPAVRIVALRGLAVPTSEEERAAVLEALDDRNPGVRIFAARAMGYPGSPGFVDLRDRIMDEDDLSVSAALIESLAAMRGVAAYRALAAGAVARREAIWLLPTVIRAAFLAQAEMGLESAPNFARSTDPRARGALADGLGTAAGRMGPAARKILDDLAIRDVPSVQATAIEALDGFSEPLGEWLDRVEGADAPRVRVAFARVAAGRIASTAVADIRDDAIDVLRRVRPGEDDGAFVREAWNAARDRAAAAAPDADLPPRVNDVPTAELPYDAIARWAASPRAAVFTVRRPGFVPGRFVVALDVDGAPVTAWNFARLAEAGAYDGLPFRDLQPGIRIDLGDPADAGFDRGDRTVRAEPVDGPFPAGALLARPPVPGADVVTGAIEIRLDARSTVRGPGTAIGRVVQNLPGVVGRLHPDDEVVSIRVYEGDGTEPLPPLPEDGDGSGR